MANRKNHEPEYTAAEIERRAMDMIQRSFSLPHKTLRDFVGKTPRARAMARRKIKSPPKSK